MFDLQLKHLRATNALGFKEQGNDGSQTDELRRKKPKKVEGKIMTRARRGLKLVRFPRFDSCAPAHLKLAPSPTRSLPPRSFAFYVAFPKSSIRPLGFPIYVARAPRLHSRSYPRRFTLITRTASCSCQLP